MRSQLAKFQQKTPKSAEEIIAELREAHDVHDIFVCTPEQRTRLPNKIIEAIVQAGKILYGNK